MPPHIEYAEGPVSGLFPPESKYYLALNLSSLVSFACVMIVGETDPAAFSERLLSAYGYCLKVLDVQQEYIDLWWDMYGLGLLAPVA